MPADPKFAKLGNLSARHRRTARAETLPAGSIALPQAATMSSWMKTLQSGANKVGTAPRINQIPRHGRDAGSMARTSQRARLLTAIT